MSSSELTERVDPDPGLSGAEKETSINMYGDDKRFSIYSAKPTIIKSLLDHDHFELEWLRLFEEEDNQTHVASRGAARRESGDIVAAKGTLPVGTLTVKSKPRANNHQSSIISTETIDASVFGDADE